MASVSTLRLTRKSCISNRRMSLENRRGSHRPALPERPDSRSVVRESELNPDQVNRLWQHGMHEERLFHDRLNYFSAIHAGLLGAFAILYNKEVALGLFAPLTAVGLAFALLWLRVQVRHWRYCVHVYERLKREVPEYAETVGAFAAPGRVDGLSIARPLVVAVPLLFAATWVSLFAWVLFRALHLVR
jgi:hypothetical protein